MRTFAQKAKPTRQTAPSKAAIPGWTLFGQRHELSSTTRLRHVPRNHAVQRLQRSNAKELNDALTGSTTPHFGFDFSRTPATVSGMGAAQTKLEISKPGDEYEKEADNVAEKVMHMPDLPLWGARTCSGRCSRSQENRAVWERAPLQTRQLRMGNAEQVEVPSGVREVLTARGRPLDSATREFMEPRFGRDFSSVRVHFDAAAGQSAHEVNADAYTVGNDMVFGAGRFAPGTPDGRRLIAHELTHVAQQSCNRSASLLQRHPASNQAGQKRTPSPNKASAPPHVPIGELKRVSDEVWELMFEGYTNAEAIGHHIWPSGLPSGIGIVPLIVVEQPFPMGLFRITGVTYDALDTMENSFAKWFFDLGLRASPPGHALHTIRLWFKAFIPQALLRAPGFDCFKGDNRSYSSDRMAPARMTSEVLLTNLDTATPTMTQTHWCGLTRQVDCDDETLIDSATADTSGMRFYNLRYPGAVVWDWAEPYPPPAHPPEVTIGPSEPLSLDYIGAAADPLVPVAPFVDIRAHIEFDSQSGFLKVSGKADDYPAFEGYVTVNEKYGPFNIFALDGDDWVISLLGGANRSFNQTISLGSYVATG